MNMKLKRYVLYGLTGWCIEVFWTGLASLFRGDVKLSSQTYLWMFFIYGFAIFLEPVHNKIRSWPMILRGGVYTVLIFGAEYGTGSFLKLLLGVCPWNYGNAYLSINSIIELTYAPAWFTAGLLFEKFHDKMTFDRVAQRT